MLPQSLNVAVFNVHGCSRNVEMGEISNMFLRWKLDVHALSWTKLKGKGEVMFIEVVGRVIGIGGGRARERMVLLLSRWLLCSMKYKEVSRIMWIRVKIE